MDVSATSVHQSELLKKLFVSFFEVDCMKLLNYVEKESEGILQQYFYDVNQTLQNYFGIK